MGRRYHYTASFSVGGDTPTWEGEVEFSYTVNWGRPETPPAYSHGGLPADPDEIDEIRVVSIDGKPKGWSFFEPDARVAEDMIERLTDDDYARMLEEASEADLADHDDAMERRWEEQRDMDRVFGPAVGDD
jgi:hypothetical protein